MDVDGAAASSNAKLQPRRPDGQAAGSAPSAAEARLAGLKDKIRQIAGAGGVGDDGEGAAVGASALSAAGGTAGVAGIRQRQRPASGAGGAGPKSFSAALYDFVDDEDEADRAAAGGASSTSESVEVAAAGDSALSDMAAFADSPEARAVVCFVFRLSFPMFQPRHHSCLCDLPCRCADRARKCAASVHATLCWLRLFLQPGGPARSPRVHCMLFPSEVRTHVRVYRACVVRGLAWWLARETNTNIYC